VCAAMNNSTYPTWTSATASSDQGSDLGTCIETIGFVPYVFLVLLSTLSCLLAVVGNTSILWAIYKNRSLQNVSNNFVASLCSSDLIAGLLVNPLSIAMVTLLRYEMEHERLESFVHFFLGVVLITTTLTLSTVSVDRYIAIVFPLRYKYLVTHRMSVRMVASTWIFAVLVASPRLILLREEAEQIIFASIVVSLSIPLVITVFCYFKILKEARKHKGLFVSPSMGAPNIAYYILKNKKTTVTMAMILGLFIAVYTPLFAFAALALSGLHVCDKEYIAADWLWPTFIICASAALNPLVYGIRNMMIRNVVKEIFKNTLKRELKSIKLNVASKAAVITVKP
jgi:hypothetical protein